MEVLSQVAMPEESKHSVFLAKDLGVLELLLREIRQNLGHSGRVQVSKLHLKYWIPHEIATIRRILIKCLL